VVPASVIVMVVRPLKEPYPVTLAVAFFVVVPL
jgi:hypothetical protein